MFKDSFIPFYMGMAKYVATAKNSCPSRQVGTVIVDHNLNKVISTGYNGPPKGSPNNNSVDWWNAVLQKYVDGLDISNDEWNSFYNRIVHSPCNVCPRKVLGIKSGSFLNLCNCSHSEQNAIATAGCNLYNSYMFAYCPLPCLDCSKMIVNAGIARLYCLATDEADYSSGARLVLEKGGVEIVELNYNDTEL